MTTIHMEVETVLSLSNKMQLFAETLTQKHQNVRSLAGNIDWRGDSREQFSTDANFLINSLDKLADNFLISSRQLSKEVDQWVSVDNAGSTKIQSIAPSNDPSPFQKFVGDFRFTYNWVVGKIDPPRLDEVWEFLAKTSTGKDLERLARENNMCFVLPNGERIGDPNAVIQVPVNFGKSEGSGHFDPATNSIIISDDIPLEDGKVGLSGILAHEMQHAIDKASGEFPPSPSFNGQSEAQIEESLELFFDAQIHSEVRAYERSENILELTKYYDDGVLTGEERNEILTHALGEGTYRSKYESIVNEAFNGQYTATISVDPTTGELKVNLIPVGRPLSEFAYSA